MQSWKIWKEKEKIFFSFNFSVEFYWKKFQLRNNFNSPMTRARMESVQTLYDPLINAANKRTATSKELNPGQYRRLR